MRRRGFKSARGVLPSCILLCPWSSTCRPLLPACLSDICCHPDVGGCAVGAYARGVRRERILGLGGSSSDTTSGSTTLGAAARVLRRGVAAGVLACNS